MKKATIVLIANEEAENLGRRLMLEAHREGNLGFEMARLPHNVSLRQPFIIPSLEEFEGFFDEFSKNIQEINIRFKKLKLYPSNVFGYDSGCMSMEVYKTKELERIQRILFDSLEKRFCPCPAEHDDDYMFHMTIAIGGASYEAYEKAYEVLKDKDYNKGFTFDRLGLLYYDDDNIKPGTYFCYKVIKL